MGGGGGGDCPLAKLPFGSGIVHVLEPGALIYILFLSSTIMKTVRISFIAEKQYSYPVYCSAFLVLRQVKVRAHESSEH